MLRINDWLQSTRRHVVWTAVGLLAFMVFGLISEYQRGEQRHGRVLDENGNAIAGAYVLIAVDMPWLDHILPPRRVLNHVYTRTDGSGNFAVHSHWRELLWKDPPFGTGSDRVSLEVCHRDFTPKKFTDKDYDNGPALLKWRGLVHENREAVVVKLNRRPHNSIAKWGGVMMWEPEVEKTCDLTDLW